MKRVDCRWAETLSVDALYEELPKQEADRLRAHLEQCPRCAARQAAFRRDRDALQELATAPAAGSLAARAMGGWTREPLPVRRGFHTPWSRHIAWAGAGAVLVAGTMVGLSHHQRLATAVRAHIARTHSIPTDPANKADAFPHRASDREATTPRPKSPIAYATGGASVLSAGRSVRGSLRENHRVPGPLTVSAVGTRPAAAPGGDETYLDGRDPARLADWMTGSDRDPRAREWLAQPLPAVQDDFVRINPPLLADGDPHSPAARDAVKKAEEEAKIVDARLFRKVTLRQKAVSLDEFCQEMTRQTEVRLRAARGVADEKVTVLVKERPAREVMREVSRLFGYYWGRTGESGRYQYELVQDLRSQLAEDEMRRRDADAALLAMHEKMQSFQPYLGLTPGELRVRAEKAKGKEREQLHDLSFNWGGLQVYQMLTPTHFTALRNGKQLQFHLQGTGNPDQSFPGVEWSLPAEWREPLIQSAGVGEVRVGDFRTLGLVRPEQAATAVPWIGLRLDRSELGQISLVADVGVSFGQGGLAAARKLAVGQSPSVQKPENATANRALRSDPAYKRGVSFRIEPDCPRWTAVRAGKAQVDPYEPLDREAHVTSADVWEAVHDATGLPIVTDAYTRLHQPEKLSVEHEDLFDALCRVSDQLGCRWRKDGDFLLARSTSFFWDKLKEIPNRQLARWRAARSDEKGLPLEDLLEMINLTDQQLDSDVVGRAVIHCWGIEEWELVGNGSRHPRTVPASMRESQRLVASFSPAQLQRAQTPGGIPYENLNPAQQQACAHIATWLVGKAIRVRYAPAGSYYWQPEVEEHAPASVYEKLPLVVERTQERALAEARRLEPGLAAKEIKRLSGLLAISFLNPDGTAAQEVGRPLIYIKK